MRNFLLGGLAAISFAAVSGELLARFALGPHPLSVTHPQIEYMFAPNQDVMRFGNRQLFNELGMRSPPLDSVIQPERILAMGDSVLNGGALTDHEALATTIATDADRFFGNVSAGSWGPRNISAWIEQFDFQDADGVVLVMSSHDFTDFPNFGPLNPRTHPTETPALALIEAVNRYLPRVWDMARSAVSDAPPDDEAAHYAQVALVAEEIAQGRSDLHYLLDLARDANIPVCLVLHPTQREIRGEEDPRREKFHRLFAARSVPVIDTLEDMANAISGQTNPFRDNIHPNDLGQKMLAEFLTQCADMAVVPS